MLELYKEILAKVSFDKLLFQKELKSISDVITGSLEINNAQKTLNEALDIQNFRRILDNPSAIETLPINFKSTVDTLLQNNQLNSGDYLKSQQLLRDKGTPVGPFINGYNNAGITNALPNNNQVATNLFNNFKPT